MNSAKQDIKDVINFTVNCNFDGDEDFIEKQRKEGINVCDKIYSKLENGNNSIQVVTQLSVSKETNEDKPEDESQHPLPNSDFYVSSLRVTSNDQNCANVTTVVGLRDSTLEAVYEASVEHKPEGRKLVLHGSYLRPANKRKLSYSSSLSKAENEKAGIVKPIVKKPSLLQRLSLSKKKKPDMREIDDLAKNHALPTPSKPQSKRPKDHASLISMKSPLPFNSFKIGDQSSLVEIFSSTRLKSRSMAQPDISIRKAAKIVATQVRDSTNDNTKMLSTTIDRSNNPEIYCSLVSVPFYDDNVSLDESVFDTDGDIPSVDHIVPPAVDMHLDMEPQITIPGRRSSCPNLTCGCGAKRLALIAEILKKVIKVEPVTNEREQRLKFNPKTLHLYDCPNNFNVGLRDGWRQSHVTLHSHCESCSSIDDPISPVVRESIDCLLDENDISIGSQIQLSEKAVNFLRSNSYYELFERQIQSVLGTRVTPYNFSRLIFITRTVVRHIGNPRDHGNEQMNRLYQFVIKYYGCHFFPHINDHHECLEDFLCNCECNNFQDVE